MKNVFIISLLCFAGKVLGQGIEAELYQYNYNLIHPSFAGGEGQRISVLGNTATYGSNFGHGEANTLALISYENYFDKIKSGIAFTGYSERMGASSLSSLALSYNYKIRIGKSADLITGAKLRRHFYSISDDFFRQIDPSDPLIIQDLSEANWAADFGLLLKVKGSYFGLLANNSVHTNDKIDVLGPENHLSENFVAIVGTSFKISDHLVSDHSLYIPIEVERYRIDLNNTLTINDLFLAGISIERTREKSRSETFARVNAGITIQDYFQVLFLIYSDKRNKFPEQKFRGEVFMGFKF